MENQVTILVEVDGELHLVVMEDANYQAVKSLIKASMTHVIPTGKMQRQLNNFLGWSE